MKNRGFSLIELIVVVAIMAVALTVGGYALSAISLANAKNCATEIKSSLEKTRTLACSTDAAITMILRVDSTGKVFIEKEGSTKEVGGRAVKVQYCGENGVYQSLDTDPETPGTDTLVFGFNRSTGGFSDSCTVKGIKVTSGGRTYTLTCYHLTGKIKME